MPSAMRYDLLAKTLEFCAYLRREYGFNVGPREALECVKAMEIVGIASRARVTAALRAICCSKPQELGPFDRAFKAFFSAAPQGAAQTRHPQRRRAFEDEAAVASDVPAIERRAEAVSASQAWQAMLARYSPVAGRGYAPVVSTEGLEAMRRAANRLVNRLRLGRSRRWKPQLRGPRFDVRATLRASLRTGGDLLEPRTLGHPLRNPRFVILLDGSRSMSEHAGPMLQFAYALCKRSRRASAFLFSTELADVTRKLRDAERREYRLEDLGEAWGGGTRIGASLSEFVRSRGTLLSDHTFVVIMSDGLDAGDVARLKSAMRQIARRCAAVAWVNPHAAQPGYTPSARGMAAALPYVSTLTSLEGLTAVA